MTSVTNGPDDNKSLLASNSEMHSGEKAHKSGSETSQSQGTKIAGIELAPADVPLPRRLQSLVIFIHTNLALICSLFATFFLLYSTWTMVLMILYFTYALLDSKDERGASPSKFVKEARYFKLFRDYFPMKLIKTSELDPSRNYIFGYHPHDWRTAGFSELSVLNWLVPLLIISDIFLAVCSLSFISGIISLGAFGNFATECTGFSSIFPGIKVHLVTLKVLFRIPFARELFLLLGVVSSSAKALSYVFKSGPGESVCIVLGGAPESLEAHPGTNTLLLADRKGFVKMALRQGVSLVPCFGFGENDVYFQQENPKGSTLRKIQEFIMRKLSFATPIFWGRGLFNYNVGLMPLRKPINVVVGDPIHLPKIDNPTTEDVDKYHKLYVDGLRAVYDAHKSKFAPERRKTLQILEYNPKKSSENSKTAEKKKC